MGGRMSTQVRQQEMDRRSGWTVGAVLPVSGRFVRWQMASLAGLLASVMVGVMGCTSSTTYNADGVNAFRQGQTQAAVQDFQQAIAVNPQDADGYYNLGATYHYAGKQSGDRQQLAQAEQLYNRCLDLSPDNVDCHRALAVLLVETGRSDKAFTLLEGWANRNPRDADAKIELARMYEEFGDRITAEKNLTEAVALNPTNARAWAALGSLRERNGQLAQALSNYQQAYQVNPQNPELATRIAQLQQQLGAPAGTLAMNPNAAAAVGTAPAVAAAPVGYSPAVNSAAGYPAPTYTAAAPSATPAGTWPATTPPPTTATGVPATGVPAMGAVYPAAPAPVSPMVMPRSRPIQ